MHPDLKYTDNVYLAENTGRTKTLLFAKPERKYYRDLWAKISELHGLLRAEVNRKSRNDVCRCVTL